MSHESSATPRSPNAAGLAAIAIGGFRGRADLPVYGRALWRKLHPLRLRPHLFDVAHIQKRLFRDAVDVEPTRRRGGDDASDSVAQMTGEDGADGFTFVD